MYQLINNPKEEDYELVEVKSVRTTVCRHCSRLIGTGHSPGCELANGEPVIDVEAEDISGTSVQESLNSSVNWDHYGHEVPEGKEGEVWRRGTDRFIFRSGAWVLSGSFIERQAFEEFVIDREKVTLERALSEAIVDMTPDK